MEQKYEEFEQIQDIIYNELLDQLSEVESIEEMDSIIEEFKRDFDNNSVLINKIENSILEEEIIYFSSAMKYLSENDGSLRLSFQIAKEYGFDLEELNSEILATILLQHNMIVDYYENKDKIIEKAIILAKQYIIKNLINNNKK